MSDNQSQHTTDFGFQQVSPEEKTEKVAEVFHSVANKYDVMNDVMSLGMHRYWKRFTTAKAQLKPGHIVLDLAGGTGDLSKRYAKAVGKTGRVFLTDINSSMLEEGRNRLIDANLSDNVSFVQVNAEHIPFPDNYFDRVSIGFGLRNVTDKDQALREMVRVLKPGGKVLVLEFSHPKAKALNTVYQKYSFNVIPKLGKLITNDEASYQYLVESIKMHPDQETLRDMIEQAGLEDVGFYDLNGGIVALHYGYKY
jgi:demethylmenaquinone methyltransferase/2-methoxy-6-polyprenyl-1,4-benzoquinol methylase